MKTVVTLAGVSLIAMASLADAAPAPIAHNAEQLVSRVVLALQRESKAEFISLFPSVDEFHRIMKESGSFYGSSLAEAQRAFSSDYHMRLLPALRQSFDWLIAEGHDLGIDWSRVQLHSWEAVPSPTEPSTMQLSIVIVDRGAEYKVVIDRALLLHGEVHVSSSIRLM